MTKPCRVRVISRIERVSHDPLPTVRKVVARSLNFGSSRPGSEGVQPHLWSQEGYSSASARGTSVAHARWLDLVSGSSSKRAMLQEMDCRARSPRSCRGISDNVGFTKAISAGDGVRQGGLEPDDQQPTHRPVARVDEPLFSA
jgi:hypothetical protein